MRALAAVLLLLTFPGGSAAAEWVRVETPHFVVFGQLGEKRTREITAEFERFREAIAQILPGLTVASAVPTTVVVFDNQRAFAPFRPRYNGKPVTISGFFMGSESDNMIALSVEDREDALRVVLHEYTHLIANNASRTLPVWANEGLAEFYSTFAVAADGKRAVLGKPIPQHYMLLAQYPLLPLDELLTVDRHSELYNEGQRRSIFYAQSWALVHMLMAGEPNRSEQFSTYLTLAAAGTPPMDAWKRAFGDFDAVRELQRYLARMSVRTYVYKFPEGVGSLKATVSKPTAAETEAILARLVRYAAVEDMEPRLRRAVDMTPASLLARALLGLAKLDAGDREGAALLLVEASKDASDWLSRYYLAVGLTRLTSEQERPDRELTAAALAAVEAVLAARPQLAHALALKARLQRGAEGVVTAARARALAPGREDYVFLEAKLRAGLRDFVTARNIVAPLMTPRYPAEVRDAARSVMGQIVRMEQFYANPPSRRGAGSMPSAGAVVGVVHAFRELKPGEQRLEGWLERIECGRNGAVTLHVRADRDVKRFTAPAFSDLDFISYRHAHPGSVSCGARTPAERVYLTWVALKTPAPGVAGIAVAVEFLPDK